MAKSKVNSIETLISQALIDMEISYKEFVTILKEKDKYEKMKENLRSKNGKQEIMRLRGIKWRTYVKNYWVFYAIKKKINQIVQISKEEYEKYEVEIFDKRRYFG